MSSVDCLTCSMQKHQMLIQAAHFYYSLRKKIHNLREKVIHPPDISIALILIFTPPFAELALPCLTICIFTWQRRHIRLITTAHSTIEAIATLDFFCDNVERR
jgi:hypothetical protein